MGYPGRDHRQGAATFFFKKILEDEEKNWRARTFFRKKKGAATFFQKILEDEEKNWMAKTFFEKKRGGADFFPQYFENQDFIFQYNFLQSKSNLC